MGSRISSRDPEMAGDRMEDAGLLHTLLGIRLVTDQLHRSGTWGVLLRCGHVSRSASCTRHRICVDTGRLKGILRLRGSNCVVSTKYVSYVSVCPFVVIQTKTMSIPLLSRLLLCKLIAIGQCPMASTTWCSAFAGSSESSSAGNTRHKGQRHICSLYTPPCGFS